MSNLLMKWRLYWLFKSAGITRKVNGFFFYLRKIPLIGKYISVGIYRNYDIKKVLFILGMIADILMKLTIKFLWVGIDIGVIFFLASINFIPEGALIEQSLVLWLLTVPLFVGILNGFGQRLSQQDVDFIANFQVSNKLFIHSRMLAETIHDALSYLPVMLIVGLVVGKPLFVPAVALLSYLGSLFLFYYLGRLISFLFKKIRLLINSLAYVLLVAIIVLVFWQGDLVLLFNAIYSLPGLLVMLIFMVVSSWLLMTYKEEERYNYWLIERSVGQLEALNTAKKSNNAYLGEGLKMQKDLKLVEGEQTTLKGNQYLNSLLFSRYKPTLTRQLKWRLLGIGGVGLLIVTLSFFVDVSRPSEKEVIGFLPLLFFVMYLLTFGKKVVQMVFINCDSSMLFYPFYREPKTILQGFYYRFWKTFYYNSIVSLSLFLMMVVINTANDFFLSISFFAILGFLLMSLSFLFSFHELFVYYILQPFSSDMEVVNPAYKIVAGVLYGIAYANLQIRSTGALYVIIVSVLSLIYVAIGVIIVWRFAPKTFRFKG